MILGRLALLVLLEIGWLAEDQGLAELVRTEAYIRGEDPFFDATDPAAEEQTCARVCMGRCHVYPLHSRLRKLRLDLCQLFRQLLSMCLEFFHFRLK